MLLVRLRIRLRGRLLVVRVGRFWVGVITSLSRMKIMRISWMVVAR